MSTYVISDIHGCYAEMMDVLNQAGFFYGRDEIIIIGDVIDRGPDSASVVEWIVNSPKDRLTFIRGNHEDLLLQAAPSPDKIFPEAWSDWALNGGYITADQLMELPQWQRRAFYDIIEKAPYHVEKEINGEILSFVHAGYAPPFTGNWLDEQDSETMLWIRDEWLACPAEVPIHTFFGHTPVSSIWKHSEEYSSPRNGFIPFYMSTGFLPPSCKNDGRAMTWNNKTAIDCGCFAGGSLCLIRLDDMAEFYCSAKEETIKAYVEYCSDYPIDDWETLVSSSHTSKNDKTTILYLWRNFHERLPELGAMQKCAEMARNLP